MMNCVLTKIYEIQLQQKDKNRSQELIQDVNHRLQRQKQIDHYCFVLQFAEDEYLPIWRFSLL